MMFDGLHTSRSAAKTSGDKYYFTGVKCVNGHTDKRKTTNGHCMECDRVRQRVRMKSDDVYRELHRKSCLKRITRLLSDPERRQQIRQREKELHHSNPARKTAKQLADQIRNQREEVILRRRENQKTEVAKQQSNRRCSIRRARLLNAMPDWLTDAMLDEIDAIYELAQFATSESGVKHEVDHIVPLKGLLVSGLHVPWNLQVIPGSDNRRKYNVFLG